MEDASGCGIVTRSKLQRKTATQRNAKLHQKGAKNSRRVEKITHVASKDVVSSKRRRTDMPRLVKNEGKPGSKGKKPVKVTPRRTRTRTSKNQPIKSKVTPQRQKLSTAKQSIKVISKKNVQTEKLEKTKDKSSTKAKRSHTVSNVTTIKMNNTEQNRKIHETKKQTQFSEMPGYFQFETVNSFAGMGNNPHSICPVTEDKAWIAFNFLDTIYLYNKNGEVEQTLKMPGMVDDIALREDGSLLVTNMRGSTVWSVDKAFKKIKTEKSFQMKPLICRGIHCLGNEVGICFVDSMSLGRSGEKAERLIVKMSNKGKIIRKYSTFSIEEGFQHPYRIGLNVNGDVLIVDHGRGQLIIMDSNGEEKSRYPDHQDTNGTYGVTCSADGFIFVPDHQRECVDVLYPDGRFCETLIRYLGRLNNIKMDNIGDLWVGSLQSPHIRIFRISRTRI